MPAASNKVIQSNDITAHLIRTRRKTASINVREGKVSIRVPLRFPETAALEFIALKSVWIKQKLQEQQQVLTANQRSFIEGESLLYLGRDYQLVIKSSIKPSVFISDHNIHVSLHTQEQNAESIRNALINWYREQASKLLENKVMHFKLAVGVEPEKISIRTCKTRWGSCSAAGRLMFNWKIMMAPEAVVDYLVVHELSHMLEHNHSSRYWQQVERVMPDYREHRKWLKDNGKYLEI